MKGAEEEIVRVQAAGEMVPTLPTLPTLPPPEGGVGPAMTTLTHRPPFRAAAVRGLLAPTHTFAWVRGQTPTHSPPHPPPFHPAAAARGLLVPTHTFAGVRGQKERSMMAVGPAPNELLAQATAGLRELP